MKRYQVSKKRPTLSAGLSRGRRLFAGRSPQPALAGSTMRHLYEALAQINFSVISCIHVYGESGTGKEIFADLLEDAVSPAPLIRLNCGSLPPTLADSILFGHRKGAFTGADTDRKGYLEEADGGWIFLDEVADLPLETQVSLLRAIDNQEITRVGETRPRKLQVNFLTATNASLESRVHEERFRNDLWQRLRELEFYLPPLRERRDEIPEIIDHVCKGLPDGPYTLTAEAKEILGGLTWKDGNVRALRNCLKAMAATSQKRVLTPASIPSYVLEESSPSSEVTAPRTLEGATAEEDLLEATSYPHVHRLIDDQNVSFDDVCLELLLDLLRAVKRRYGRVSVSQLRRMTGIPKSTFSRRVRTLVDRGFIERDELYSIANFRDI